MVKTEISFIKDVEMIDGKADTTYSALSNEIEKYNGVESLIGFGSDGASVITEHKKVAPKFKRDNSKIISILCDNHRLGLAKFLSSKKVHFLQKQ